MTLSGIGQAAIAKRLNADGVPPFGRAPYWQRSYVCKVLDNPAVVGDFHPHIDEYVSGKRTRRPLDVVHDYYPTVVARETFDTVRAMRAENEAPRTRGEIRSLVAGLAACPRCGGSMVRVSKASSRKASKPYLACSKARYGAGCDMPSVPMESVEEGLLASADTLTKDVPAAVGVSKDSMAATDRQIADLSARIRRVMEAIETGDDEVHRPEPLSAAGQEAAREEVRLQREGRPHRRHLVARLTALEGELAGVERERRRLEERLAAVDGPTLRARLRELRAAFADGPFSCARANAALRALFSRIIVDRDRAALVLYWHFGGLSELAFNPTPAARREKAKSVRVRELLEERPTLTASEISALIPCSTAYVRVVKARTGLDR